LAATVATGKSEKNGKDGRVEGAEDVANGCAGTSASEKAAKGGRRDGLNFFAAAL
jgi:hypothetical protein